MKIVIDNAIPELETRLSSLKDSNQTACLEIVSLPGVKIDREVVRDADILATRTRTRCNASLLEGSSVRLVATATAGTDHIDIPWCESNGITVASAAGSNAPGVAQYILSALLRAGFNPATQTLGVVGKGHVGAIVTHSIRLLGGKVIISDPPRSKSGFSDEDYLELENVLEKCDAVTFHVPLTMTGEDNTFHLLNHTNAGLLRPGTIVANAARGGVVNEKTLLTLIEEKNVTAIVDTWENEPVINRELLEKAYIATPHIAGYSAEGKQRATHAVLTAIEDFIRVSTGKPGFWIDKRGLAGQFIMPDQISTQTILDSYNPLEDTALLRKEPDSFESIRNRYNFRPEPRFHITN